MEEIFDSAVRSAGDLAGVFEFDGETCYFYLYQVNSPESSKVCDAIQITSGVPIFCQSDISIQWDVDEKMVGLIICGTIWAVFDCVEGEKFGGNFQVNTKPSIPIEVTARFFKK